MPEKCRECGHELTLTGITHRHGSKHYHCENCHLDQSYIQDPAGSNFWDTREQHDPDDCNICADGGPPQPRG